MSEWADRAMLAGLVILIFSLLPTCKGCSKDGPDLGPSISSAIVEQLRKP